MYRLIFASLLLLCLLCGPALALGDTGSSCSYVCSTLGKPVYLAGLVDGFNPCVFSIYAFVVSCLFFLKKQKFTILGFGVLYSISVFLTNFLIGAMAFTLFSWLNQVTGLPIKELVQVLKCGAVLGLGLLIAVLLLELLQYTRPYLYLPRALVQKIHAFIRGRVGGQQIIWSAIPIGIVATLFELPCSGQIYAPFLAYLFAASSKHADFSSLLELVAYNLCFILPLLVLVAFAFAGTQSLVIKDFYQKHLWLLKTAELLVLGLLLYVVVMV